jgi:glycosyltransferase involved in cell wall biosynthesis
MKSNVAISPIRFGAGTQYKILEALSAGVPVVATSLGLAGLDLRPDREILIADTPEEFANAIVRLLNDPSLAKVIGSSGQERVLQKYNWKKIGEDYDKICSSVTNGRSANATSLREVFPR